MGQYYYQITIPPACGKILTPAMSKIAEGRLKLLTDPSVLTNESNSFNHALLQSYLKKRKLAIALTLPLKQ